MLPNTVDRYDIPPPKAIIHQKSSVSSPHQFQPFHIGPCLILFLAHAPCFDDQDPEAPISACLANFGVRTNSAMGRHEDWVHAGIAAGPGGKQPSGDQFCGIEIEAWRIDPPHCVQRKPMNLLLKETE